MSHRGARKARTVGIQPSTKHSEHLEKYRLTSEHAEEASQYSTCQKNVPADKMKNSNMKTFYHAHNPSVNLSLHVYRLEA